MASPTLEIYMRWSSSTGGRSLSDFFAYLGEHCRAEASDLLTEDDLLELCQQSGESMESCEEALMEVAWP